MKNCPGCLKPGHDTYCLICNSDAHLKNFSLLRNEEHGDYTLTPAYDLLNTRLHVPDETRTALPLFKDDFETPSYQANGFYAYDDFQEFAKRLRLHKDRATRILRAASGKEGMLISMIDRSALSEECKQIFMQGFRESSTALSYSYEAGSP
jgi:serine/threonine-protein kinase HipA